MSSYSIVRVFAWAAFVVGALFIISFATVVFADDTVTEPIVVESTSELIVEVDPPPQEEVIETTEVTEVIAQTTEDTSVEEQATVAPEEDVATTEEEASTTGSDTSSEVSVETPVQQSASAGAAMTPALSTELPDYQPGEIVTGFGRYFAPLKNFVVRIFGNSEVGDFWADISVPVTSDGAGSFTFTTPLDNFYRPVYHMTATDLETGLVIAEGSFTDAPNASVDTFDQCANGNGSGPTCSWTNGNLNVNNSTYSEEDATVQRLLLKGLANGTHVVTIEYDTTKGGKHAYDFLTDPFLSESWVTDANLCSGLTAFAGCTGVVGTPSPNIPADPLNTSGTDASNQNIFIKNGTITAISAPALISGSYAGDSTTRVNVTFTVDTATCVNGSGSGTNAECPALLYWGAHVSSQADWGGNSSAVNISGSPYHVRVTALDGKSTGNRDNQMSASVIPSTITIRKVTSNGSTQSFAFTTTGTGLTGFNLQNGGSNSQLVASGGTFSVTETAVSEWTLSNIQCSVTGTGVTATPNVGARTVSINISNQANGGNVVDCTFFNEYDPAPLPATLTIHKVVVNDNGGTATVANFQGTINGNNVAWDAPQILDAGTYALSETGASGYAASSWSCTGTGGTLSGSDVTLAEDASVICTITNDDIAPKLTVIKHVINDNGGTAVAGDFSMLINGTNVSPAGQFPGSETGTMRTLDAGVYGVAESNQPGYLPSFGTDCAGTIAVGEEKTCVVTNDDVAPTLTVIKVVDNGETGATYSASDFQMMIDGGAVTKNVAHPVSVGSHSVTESGPSGYAAVYSGDCDAEGDVSLSIGQNKTCTITNTAIAPQLKLVKTVVNNNGGTKVVADFPLFIDASGVTSGVFNAVTVGLHTATETPDAGYTASAWGGDCAANGTVSLALGESKTCTITNDDNAPSLTLVKEVINDNGGTAVAGDWTLTADGYDAQSPQAGTYDLSETGGPSGYAQTSLMCSNAVGQVTSVTLGLGEQVTCTFVNDDQPGTLIVKKIVDNGETGATTDATAFSFSVNAAAPVSFEIDGQNDLTVNAGTYSVTEPAVNGYTTSYQNCTNVAVSNGETETCVITNTAIAPTLTIVKNVVNDNGGSAVAADFQGKIDGVNKSWGTAHTMTIGAHTASEVTLPGYTASVWGTDCAADGSVSLALGENKTCSITNDDEQAYVTVNKVVTNDNGGSAQSGDFNLTLEGNAVTSGVAVPVNPGTYTAGETNLSGYTFEGFTGDCDANGDVTVELGESKTCTLTNNDQQAYIIVDKTVINDNGGTAAPDDFLLTLDGNATTDGAQIPVNPGTYTAGETNLPGYTAGAWGGHCSVEGLVTVALGETKTCTITNNDNAPSLTLVKQVITDNGGTAVADDWTLIADGYDTDSPDAGTYDLTETGGPAGYTQTSLTCSNSGDAQVDTVTLGLGEQVTCTFVNDDDAPSLTLVKEVINNNGGTAVPADFTLTATNYDSLSPDAGTYDLSESGPDGYAQMSLTCSNSGDTEVNSVTLGLGEDAICTFVNDDIAPSLTLNKVVVNDNNGGEDESAWTLTADGGNAGTLSGAGASGDADVVSDGTFQTGIYALSEAGAGGYLASAWTCVGGTQNGASITLTLGQSAVCTITNDDIQPKLTVTKIVINDDGGTKVVADFPLFVGATPVTSGVQGLFDVGSYTVSETAQFGYAATIGGDCASDGSITLAPGDVKECTITNDDIAPRLTVIKHVINNNGGANVAGDFTMNVTGTNVSDDSFPGAEAPGTTVTLDAGAYSVDEVKPAGYIKTLSADCSGTIAVGEEKTCTITNDDTPGHFTGGGSVFPNPAQGAVLGGVGKNPKDTRVTHGFTLHCDVNRLPNRLEINWGPAKNSQKFHLTTLSTAVCSDNPAIDPQQPNAEIDTIQGTGVGRYNGVDGATISFTFDDAGEPGKNDRATMKIWDVNNNLVLDTAGHLYITVGNQQAHQDN